MKKDDAPTRTRAVYVNGDETERLLLAREKLVPNHHHNDALSREVELWWGVTSGDALIEKYGEDAVRSAHEKMQGYSPEQLDLIHSLGGYFRTLCNDMTGTASVPLGRTMPRMKRDLEASETEQEALRRREERKRVAQETPGTLEWRLKHGSASNVDVDDE